MQTLLPVKNSLLILFIPAFLISSCSTKKDNNLAVFDALNKSLVNANIIINKQNDLLYTDINDKLRNIESHEHALVWQPKAVLIKQLSADITAYIENLKDDLVNKASNGTDSFREDNIDSVDLLFAAKGKYLQEKLKKYNEDMLNVDSEMSSEISKDEVFNTLSSIANKQDFVETYFKHVPAIAALAMLNKFENDSKIMENNMVTYCKYKAAFFRDLVYEKFNAIINLSSYCVKVGDEIEIRAGVGVFNDASQPVITINGKNAPVTDEGVAVYKLKAPLQPGKYKVPVNIRFTKPDGLKDSLTKVIEYSVVKNTE